MFEALFAFMHIKMHPFYHHRLNYFCEKCCYIFCYYYCQCTTSLTGLNTTATLLSLLPLHQFLASYPVRGRWPLTPSLVKVASTSSFFSPLSLKCLLFVKLLILYYKQGFSIDHLQPHKDQSILY